MHSSIEQLCLETLQAGALDIRNVDDGAEPFLYASGNYGPGYVSIKGLVGRKTLFKKLLGKLAEKIATEAPQLDFVAGNVTGGQIPGWVLSENLEQHLGRTVPYVYVRDMRKKGGQKEMITGLHGNPEIKSGANVLVVEELVNFAATTCNSATLFRDSGYVAAHAACVLYYGNPNADQALQNIDLKMIYLFTLGQLLDVAESTKWCDTRLINSYRAFLRDPLDWQKQRGLAPLEEGGTR